MKAEKWYEAAALLVLIDVIISGIAEYKANGADKIAAAIESLVWAVVFVGLKLAAATESHRNGK